MTFALRHRWPLLCALGVAVSGLHGLLLFALAAFWLEGDRPRMAAPTMQVRSVRVAAVPTAPESLPEVAPDLPSGGLPPSATAPTPVPAVPRVPPVPRPAQAPPAAHREVPAPSPVDAAVLPLEVPVYATRLPPAGRWRYRLQRGTAVGDAELQWSMSDEGYALRLEGRIAGVTLLEWASQGRIDAAGVAPERFAVRRRGRDRQAANFQRDLGKITFSGPTHESPLLPGAQDRLSWILQVPAIVAAVPDRFLPGASIVLFVAGARGDADVWTFVVQGLEAVGERQALKLLREPRQPYDTRAEIWLDPAESYLPLRVLQTPSGGGAALDLQREAEAR